MSLTFGDIKVIVARVDAGTEEELDRLLYLAAAEVSTEDDSDPHTVGASKDR